MLDTKLNETDSGKLNKSILKAVGVAMYTRPAVKNFDVQEEINGLTVVRCGMTYGVNNGECMVLPPIFESITILENGWMVTARHGIYDLYDYEGHIYKGLSFLKKENAIRFAKML